mmetsp:Transcript_5311/g.15794  ORF Transcript_5311/g.15794 Transcript_5311/m.15794 type:complete len:259 (-) Transcript_5311:390-1166(-)
MSDLVENVAALAVLHDHEEGCVVTKGAQELHEEGAPVGQAVGLALKQREHGDLVVQVLHRWDLPICQPAAALIRIAEAALLDIAGGHDFCDHRETPARDAAATTAATAALLAAFEQANLAVWRGREALTQVPARERRRGPRRKVNLSNVPEMCQVRVPGIRLCTNFVITATLTGLRGCSARSRTGRRQRRVVCTHSGWGLHPQGPRSKSVLRVAFLPQGPRCASPRGAGGDVCAVELDLDLVRCRRRAARALGGRRGY